jgi:hypothetical protein
MSVVGALDVLDAFYVARLLFPAVYSSHRSIIILFIKNTIPDGSTGRISERCPKKTLFSFSIGNEHICKAMSKVGLAATKQEPARCCRIVILMMHTIGDVSSNASINAITCRSSRLDEFEIKQSTFACTKGLVGLVGQWSGTIARNRVLPLVKGACLDSMETLVGGNQLVCELPVVVVVFVGRM